MILKDLPQDSRPREKLLARGPAALSDAELLALLLRTGIPGKNRVADGPGTAGHLRRRGRAAAHHGRKLKRIRAWGAAKRAQLVAVLELARRALAGQLKKPRCSTRRRPCATICSCNWATGRTKCSPSCSSTASTG